MTIYEKIIQIYPELVSMPELFYNGAILLQNDSDGNGDYIKSWNYPSPQPTQEQLDSIQ